MKSAYYLLSNPAAVNYQNILIKVFDNAITGKKYNFLQKVSLLMG